MIAEGTPEELKLKIGGEVVEMHLEQRDEVARAAQTIAGLGAGDPTIDEREGSIRVPVGADGSDVLLQGVRRLDDADIRVADIALHRPTLDDVFLSLTGRHAEDEGDTEDEPASDGTSRRGRKEHG